LEYVVLPGHNVIKAWSLVFPLEAARPLAQLVFDIYMVVQAPVTKWAAIAQDELDPETALFASVLHSASSYRAA